MKSAAPYKGGENKIAIPANVPIVALVPADTEKRADGTLLSGAVLFGKGVVPPM
jgi:hypothetical protein